MFGMKSTESRWHPLAPFKVFAERVFLNFLVTMAIVAFSLAIGTLGYHYLGNVGWVDGLLNAAMILTGMGPVDKMETTGGKLFATFYALYSGIAFLTMIAVLIAPIYHRFLHRFHLASEQEDNKPNEDANSTTPPVQ
jgi:hypothetical protein